MGLIDWIRDKIKKDEPEPSNDKALGPIYARPSEKDKLKDSGVKVEDKSGSVGSSGGRSSGGRSSGGRSSGGGSSSSRSPPPIKDKPDVIEELERQTSERQTQDKRQFFEEIKEREKQARERQERLNELRRRQEFLDRQYRQTKNQSISKEEFDKILNKKIEIDNKVREMESYSSPAPVTQVGLPTGKEALTQRWSEAVIPFMAPGASFSDVVYDDYYGQGTEIKKDKYFAGYTETGTPEFVSPPPGMTTLGEKQLDIQAEKFAANKKAEEINRSYLNDIQKEYEKDIKKEADKLQKTYQKLVNEGKLNPSEANKSLQEEINRRTTQILNSKKYKDLENKAIKDLEKINIPRDIEELYKQDFKTKRQRILEYVPILGSGKEAIKSLRDWSSKEQASVGGYKALGLGKSRGLAALNTALVGLDVAAVGSVARAGIGLSRTAIQKELAKRTSRSLEQLRKAKITGVNFIEEGGRFYLVGSQRTGNFIRPFKVQGQLIKQGSKYSFIPKGEGSSVIVGISEAKLKGISGKAKSLISKISGQPNRELFVMPETFEISGAGVSRNVPMKFRNLAVSRSQGIGVFTPIERSSAILRRGSRKGLKEQLQRNIKRGGDPIVSQMVSPQFSGRFGGRQATLEISKGRNILSYLYKPKKSIKRLSLKKPKPSSRREFSFSDDILGSPRRKPTIERKPEGRMEQLFETPKKVQQNQQVSVTEMLQEGFEQSSQPIIKPFTFAAKRAALKQTARTGTRILGACILSKSLTGNFQKTRGAVSNLSRNLTGQKGATRQITRTISKPKKTTGQVSSISPIASVVGGIGGIGGIRPRGLPTPIIRKSRKTPSKPTKKTFKKRRKGLFDLQITGFQAVTGRKAIKRKPLGSITGFEALR